MKMDFAHARNNTEMGVGGVALHLSLTHSYTGLFYCELNSSGTQEEVEFEMQKAEEGQGEGRDKG